MRHELIRFLGATLLAATTATVGCGGGDDGAGTGGTGASGGSGGGSSFSTLSGSATLSSLAEADSTKLCNETYAYFRTAITNEMACKWKGLSFATSSSAPTEEQLKANCTEKESGCLADPNAALGNNPGCDFPVGCLATVAEYSTCVEALVARFNQTVVGLSSCTALTKVGTDGVWAALAAAPPPSCMFTNCNGLYPPDPLL